MFIDATFNARLIPVSGPGFWGLRSVRRGTCSASRSPLRPQPCLPVSAERERSMPQGGEALHRNSIITFSSLARRLEAQTAAVPCSARPSLRWAWLLPPPAGLCLLHRTDAFCRQASALKGAHATFLSLESLQWTWSERWSLSKFSLRWT